MKPASVRLKQFLFLLQALYVVVLLTHSGLLCSVSPSSDSNTEKDMPSSILVSQTCTLHSLSLIMINICFSRVNRSAFLTSGRGVRRSRRPLSHCPTQDAVIPPGGQRKKKATDTRLDLLLRQFFPFFFLWFHFSVKKRTISSSQNQMQLRLTVTCRH